MNETANETKEVKKDDVNPLTEGEAALRGFFTPVTPAGALSDDSPQPTVSTVPTVPITEDEKALTEMVDQLDVEPVLTYEERLKLQGISMEDALVIVDALMTNGVYEKEYLVTKKHTVKFKTRSMEDQGKFVKDLEHDSPMYAATTNAMLARHNLAASLVVFKDTKFKDYEHALTFAVKLPEQVFRILIEKLRKFDLLIMTVMDEGALENF